MPTEAPSSKPTTTSPTTSAPTNPPSPKPTISASPVTSLPTASPTVKPTPRASIIVAGWNNPDDPSAPVGTYFSFEEAVSEALYGPLCQHDPCQDQNVSCGEHGTCLHVRK